jgi:hypothetical protein
MGGLSTSGVSRAQDGHPVTNSKDHFPYAFGNFVWWSDSDLRAELKRHLPTLAPLIGYRFQTSSLPVAGLDCTGWRFSSEMGGDIVARCFVASGGITLQPAHMSFRSLEGRPILPVTPGEPSGPSSSVSLKKRGYSRYARTTFSLIDQKNPNTPAPNSKI